MDNPKLLVFVLNRTELLDSFMAALNDAGIRGATVINSTGMAQSLASHEDSHIIASLRAFMTAGTNENKTIFMLLSDEQIKIVRRVVGEVIGDLSRPHTGILFTLPIDSADGFYKES